MKPKTLNCKVKLWQRGKDIHIAICEANRNSKDGEISTVNNMAGNKRYHKNLYAKFKKLLKRNKLWVE